MRTRKLAIEIIAALLILLWVYAAISKILDYETFKAQLGKSPLLTSFAGPAAIGVPAVEIVIAVTLLFKRTQVTGFYASFFLMVMFTAYLIAILNFSYDVPCSCGGIIGKGLAWEDHIYFNLFFVAIALMAIILESGKIARFILRILQNTAQSGQAENL